LKTHTTRNATCNPMLRSTDVIIHALIHQTVHSTHNTYTTCNTRDYRTYENYTGTEITDTHIDTGQTDCRRGVSSTPWPVVHNMQYRQYTKLQDVQELYRH
jgi:hypothetical protein